jgi:DNA repair exonuclease SbcCD nuclease subunit
VKTKVLAIGDMHAVPEELDDCNAVIGLALKVCRTEEIQEVWFLGDQHHTHAVLRLEVMHWWRTAFKALHSEGIRSVCLVGNHDQASPGSSVHAMMAYDGYLGTGVRFVDQPTVHRDVLMLPYYHDEETFQEACRAATQVIDDKYEGEVLVGPRTVVCHQTFNGANYENGFLASDGFDPAQPPQELIISGHIHTGQEFGRVWYLGSPRWRSLSDANVDRAIWVLEFENGRLIDRRPYSTGDVCRQIRHLVDSPESPVQLPLDPKHQWRIDIQGPADWCQARKLALKAAGARIRAFPDQIKAAGRVRESAGIESAFRAYLDLYQAKYGTAREALEAMAKERLGV